MPDTTPANETTGNTIESPSQGSLIMPRMFSFRMSPEGEIHAFNPLDFLPMNPRMELDPDALELARIIVEPSTSINGPAPAEASVIAAALIAAHEQSSPVKPQDLVTLLERAASAVRTALIVS